MIIRNLGRKYVEIQGTKSTVTINLNECIQVDFRNGMSFAKPGEYEFGGIDIISREVLDERGYSACANVTKLTVEGIRVLLLLNSVEAKQDDLNQVLDIDVLVIPDSDLEKIDRLAMLYNPKKIIILQENLKDSEITDLIKKSFSTSQITVEKQIKSKSDEYSSENFLVSFSILKK